MTLTECTNIQPILNKFESYESSQYGVSCGFAS